MIYIFETEFNNNKSVFINLKNIYGIGNYYSDLVCKKLGFSKNYKSRDLTKKQILRLIKTLKNLNIDIGSNLKRKVENANTKLVNIKTYRGLRKLDGFPVRGQRTRSNAQTAKRLSPKARKNVQTTFVKRKIKQKQ